MNRLLFLGFIIVAASCKREPLTTYNSDDNVYFNYTISSNYYIDSLDFSFAYSDASVQDTMLRLPIAVTGAPATIDRRFNLVIDPASTAMAGTHYELPQLVMPAGKVFDTLLLRLKRTADLATGVKKIFFRLEPNEFFKTGLSFRVLTTAARDTVDMLNFTVAMSDILSKGQYWDVQYAQFFGQFSVKKVRLMNELWQMPLTFWSVASLTNQHRAAATYYASTTSRYLAEQASQGNIIYDEDGTPMQMGPAYQ